MENFNSFNQFVFELESKLKIKTVEENQLFDVSVMVKKKVKSKSFYSKCRRFINDEFILTILPYSDRTIEIFKIEVMERGNGLGSKLMNIVLDVADDLNMSVKLIPIGYSRDKNTPKEYDLSLRNWYESFGFRKDSLSILPYYTYKPNTSYQEVA